MTHRPITLDTLGAWIIKCNPSKTDLEPMIADGRAEENWCVANNYRTRLMEPGQQVLFWVSAHRQRGIWGAGTITARPTPGARWTVATDMALFGEPVLASSLASVPGLASLEVFRSPQQSNPSWVDADAWTILGEMLPEPGGTSR